MKKVFCIILVLLLVTSVNTYAQETYNATVTDSKILVNKKEVNFTAYNINGYNYFKLRDIAAAFMDTDKQFDISGSSSYISIYTNTAYKPIGNELSSTSDEHKSALKKRISLTVNSTANEDRYLNPYVYNIDGYNYMKLRDFAVLLNFYVSWDEANNTVIIDTHNEYELQPVSDIFPQEVYESYTPVFINEMPINSYTIGKDAIGFPGIDYYTSGAVPNEYGTFTNLIPTNYIIAEDLEGYGFDIYKDEKTKTISIIQNPNKKFTMMDGILVNRKVSPEKAFDLNASEYTVELDGDKVKCYSIGSETLISIEALLKYGEINTLRPGISFDFLKHQLEQNYNSVNTVAFTKDDIDTERIKKLLPNTQVTSYVYFVEDFSSQVSDNLLNGICKFFIMGSSSGRSEYRYIGYVKNDCMNGKGYYILKARSDGIGAWLRNHDDYEIGVFKSGIFYDGVSYTGQTTGGEGDVFYATRKEGAMFDGYRRECVYPPEGDFRFGYRVVCEGTVENGKYVGYYRHYDDDGKLIFEGQYSDYVKNKSM